MCDTCGAITAHATGQVRKLEPGTAVIVREGRIVKRWRHYALPAPGPDISTAHEDWTA